MHKKMLQSLELETKARIEKLKREASIPTSTEEIDKTNENLQEEFRQNMLERETKYLGYIRRAIEMVANGSYGVCRECGCNIPEKRLKAVPIASLCVDCKN